MYNSFLVFEFGSNEEAAQQARHKLEGWKQAFRLDKKLLYKFDRGAADGASGSVGLPEPVKGKTPPRRKAPGKSKPEGERAGEGEVSEAKLIVRLYFSGHEKMSHQRWLERIPSEEPFKSASPRVLKSGSEGFDELASQFDALD
jgi:hypothetical protein